MQGSMKTVIDCLLALRARFMPSVVGDNFSLTSLITKSGSPLGEERRKVVPESKFQRVLRAPVVSGIVVALPLFLCVRMCTCVELILIVAASRK